MSEPVVITWLRHGQVEGPANVLRGRSEEPLSSTGRAQMRAALAEMSRQGVAFNRVFTSPRRRCAEFATEFAREQVLPLELLDGLAELDFGDWEGRDPRELPAEQAAQYAQLRKDPASFTPPGGEPWAAFMARLTAVIDHINYGAGPALVITHAGVMRAALVRALGLAPGAAQRVALAPAAWMRISYLAGAQPVLLDLRSQC